MGNLAYYVFRVNTSTSRSDRAFLIRDDFNRHVVESVEVSHVGTARARAIGGSESPGGFCTLLMRKLMTPFPGSNPFVIHHTRLSRSATAHTTSTKVSVGPQNIRDTIYACLYEWITFTCLPHDMKSADGSSTPLPNRWTRTMLQLCTQRFPPLSKKTNCRERI